MITGDIETRQNKYSAEARLELNYTESELINCSSPINKEETLFLNIQLILYIILTLAKHVMLVFLLMLDVILFTLLIIADIACESLFF